MTCRIESLRPAKTAQRLLNGCQKRQPEAPLAGVPVHASLHERRTGARASARLASYWT